MIRYIREGEVLSELIRSVLYQFSEVLVYLTLNGIVIRDMRRSNMINENFFFFFKNKFIINSVVYVERLLL
jgi:hypothetical protein